MRTNKYGNRAVIYKGERYDSEKECNRAVELEMLERAGKIQNIRRQVKFDLIPKQSGERAVKYIADFVYMDCETGKVIVEDVKSSATRTKDYIIKRKLFKWQYPDYEFREVIM